MPLSFSKYSGSGNDFVFIEKKSLSPQVIRQLCHRSKGIGADGVMLVQESSQETKCRIFNADGGEAELCGNALCCLGLFLRKNTPSSHEFSVRTASGLHRLCCLSMEGESALVRVQLRGESSFSRFPFSKERGKGCIAAYLGRVGVPHLVFFIEDKSLWETFPFSEWGCYWRHHSPVPEGVNVNLVLIDFKSGRHSIRTYERGVEGETNACGTGAAAAAISVCLHYGIPSPLSFLTRLDDMLTVSFQREGKNIGDLFLQGMAEHIFTGVYPCSF